MPITNYTELQDSIAEFLNRDDLTATIPTFISLAEADINRLVRHWRMEKRANAILDTQYSALPGDFLETIRFYITSNNTQPLELVGQAELLDRKYQNSNTLGMPSYYTITAGEIEVFPIPDGQYNAEIYYYARVPTLSASNPTNWLLDYFPDAYLYSALIHTAPYLQDDARMGTWAALQKNAIDAMNVESEKSKFGGSGRRMKVRAY